MDIAAYGLEWIKPLWIASYVLCSELSMNQTTKGSFLKKKVAKNNSKHKPWFNHTFSAFVSEMLHNHIFYTFHFWDNIYSGYTNHATRQQEEVVQKKGRKHGIQWLWWTKRFSADLKRPTITENWKTSFEEVWGVPETPLFSLAQVIK